MTLNQVNGVLRALVPALLAYAVGKGWISNEQVGEFTAVVVALVSGGWSVWTNRESK